MAKLLSGEPTTKVGRRQLNLHKGTLTPKWWRSYTDVGRNFHDKVADRAAQRTRARRRKAQRAARRANRPR